MIEKVKFSDGEKAIGALEKKSPMPNITIVPQTCSWEAKNVNAR